MFSLVTTHAKGHSADHNDKNQAWESDGECDYGRLREPVVLIVGGSINNICHVDDVCGDVSISRGCWLLVV